MRLSLGLGLGGSGAAWTPAALFASGEKGVWYDPSDSATMANAVDETVAQINDKSGNGNHAAHATLGPTLRSSGGLDYLEYATGMVLDTPAIDLTGGEGITIIAGVRKSSDASVGFVVESSGGTFYLSAPHAAANPSYRMRSRGSASASATAATGYAAPVTNVLTGQGQISSDTCILRVDGAQVAADATDQGTGTFGNVAWGIGGRVTIGTNGLNGNIYGLIIVARLLTADEIAAAEAWMNAKAGL